MAVATGQKLRGVTMTKRPAKNGKKQGETSAVGLMRHPAEAVLKAGGGSVVRIYCRV